MRPEWDQYFLRLVPLIASRSTCLRRKVGAVIVRNNRIVSTGYNGSPSSLNHCQECLRQKLEVPSGQRLEVCRAVHAETNAILFAPSKDDLQGATIYLSTTPCSLCARILITVKIGRIVYYEEAYPDTLSLEMLKEAGVKLDHVKLDRSAYRDLGVEIGPT